MCSNCFRQAQISELCNILLVRRNYMTLSTNICRFFKQASQNLKSQNQNFLLAAPDLKQCVAFINIFSKFILPHISVKIFSCRADLPLFPDSLNLLLLLSNQSNWYNLTVVKGIVLRCAMMWLISQSSRWKSLVVTIRLGDQALLNFMNAWSFPFLVLPGMLIFRRMYTIYYVQIAYLFVLMAAVDRSIRIAYRLKSYFVNFEIVTIID